MQGLIIVVAVNFLCLFLVSAIIPGIEIANIPTLLASAIVLTFINIFLKPILKIIFLPINILSLGFFTLIINGLLLYFISGIIKGFYVSSFGAAFFGALLLSIIYMLLEKLVMENPQMFFKRYTQVDNKSKYQNVIDVEEIKDDKEGK